MSPYGANAVIRSHRQPKLPLVPFALLKLQLLDDRLCQLLAGLFAHALVRHTAPPLGPKRERRGVLVTLG